MNTFAIVPAAGKSRRMGRSKLALPLFGQPVLQLVVAALRQGGVAHVLVVIAPHVAELKPLAEASGAHVLALPKGTADMRATVEHGLQWLEEHHAPAPDDAWLLVPADHPMLDGSNVRLLLEARAAYPQRSIFVPAFKGQRGHPTLIGWKHVAAMRSLPAGQGLNVYLRQQAAETLEVPASHEVLMNLNTPEDYERQRR